MIQTNCVVVKALCSVSYAHENQSSDSMAIVMSIGYTLINTVDTRYLDISRTLQKCRDIRMST